MQRARELAASIQSTHFVFESFKRLAAIFEGMNDDKRARESAEELIRFAENCAITQPISSRGENDSSVANALAFGHLLIGKLDFAEVAKNGNGSFQSAMARLQLSISKAERAKTVENIICARKAKSLIAEILKMKNEQQSRKIPQNNDGRIF